VRAIRLADACDAAVGRMRMGTQPGEPQSLFGSPGERDCVTFHQDIYCQVGALRVNF
jgi:hypothetical protein